MLPKIHRIQASNFRGIRDLQINTPKGESLLIIGDNGSGKSSIIDAIEFFYTGAISKFSGRGDVAPSDCIPFAGSDPQSCYVDFKFENIPVLTRAQFIPAATNKGSVVRGSVAEDLKTLIDIASKRPFILHRAQLTQFIESKPHDRFTSISELIGIESLDKTVEAWKKERTERERKKGDAERNFKILNGEFSTLLDRTILSEDDIYRAINARISPFGSGQISNPEEIEGKKNQLAAKSSNSQNLPDTGKYRIYMERVKQILEDWNGFLREYGDLYAAWQSYLEKADCISESDFEAVIEEGRRLIFEKQLETCPVCEQPIEPLSVIERLDQRRQELVTLVESKNSVEAKRLAANHELLNCLSPLQSLQHTAKDIKINLPERLEESWDVLEAIRAGMNRNPIVLEPPECWKNHEVIKHVIQELSGSLVQAEKEIEILTPSDEDQKIGSILFFLGQVKGKWLDWRKADEELQRASKVFELVNLIYSQLVEARKNGIGKIVEDLEKDFVRLFEKLHPGEGHKAIQIILQDHRDASADLRTETEGMKPMHPLGNLSEGHLDSLGLCIFLAFIKHFSQDLPLIVLDDVLTSIDAGHRMKVAQLVASEFKGNQLIITTHDEMWANELVTVIRKEQIPLKVIRMNPWNKENGATYDEYIASYWDYYKGQVAQGRKQDAIGGAGRNLEQFLATMRRHLHLAVPATLDDRYTLGLMLPAFWKWAGEHNIQRPDEPEFANRLNVLKEEFDTYWKIRNWSGAHYNEWGSTVSQQEAATFIAIIEELVNAFQCPACSSLVIYDPDQKLLKCPVCNPAPPVQARWEYRPDWIEQADRFLVNITNIRHGEKNLVRMSQSAFERLLKDSRRRLRLPVPTEIDDRYGIAELFQPYFDHLHKHPCSEDGDWAARLAEVERKLCEALTADFAWQPMEALASRAEEIYRRVRTLAEMVSCAECHDLMVFDAQTDAYSCLNCEVQQEKWVASPAAWFVS